MAKSEIPPDAAEIASYLGSQIKARREKLKMTQVELSKQVGIKQGIISEMESGYRRVTIANLAKFCHALKCRPNALLNF